MEPKQIHVAALVFPFASHPGSLVSLVRRLSAAAPNIVFSFHCTAKFNATLFSESTAEADRNIKAFDVSDGVPKGHVFSGHGEERINLFLAVAPANFMESIKAAEAEIGRRVSCLITEALLSFSSDLAVEMGVPWIPYFTSAAVSLSIHYRTDLIREKFGSKQMEDVEPLKFIPGMSKVGIDDLQEGIISGNLKSPFSESLRKMGTELQNAAAVIVNSFEELEPVVVLDLKSSLRKVLCLGPTSPTSRSFSDEAGCLRWLDGWGPVSVAYLAFGSVGALSPEEMQALAEALEDAELPFLWSIKDELRQLLPDGFVERTKEKGKLVSWAPQVQVLDHASVGAFVTHCGWNSVMEGIVSGVPMICRPMFGDHGPNARMVESVWEIGVKIPGGRFTKSGLVGALRCVFSSEEGDKMRAAMSRLRKEALNTVAPDGSSTANFKTLVEIITNM